MGLTINIGNDKTKGPLSQSAKVRQALDLSIDREALNQVVFNGEFIPGNQWVSPEHPYYQKAFPVRPRDVAKAKALLKEAGVSLPGRRRFHGAEGRGERGRRPGDPVDGGGSRLRPEDPRHRIRDLVQAGPGRRIPGLPASAGAAASIPTATPTSSCTAKAPQNYSGYSNPEADKALEDARLVTDQAQRKAIYEKLTKVVLNDEPIIYLYHRKVLIAHTTKLEGYKQMPDGLVRVIGLKLK